MDAGKSTISGVFNGSRLLEIPFYQRAYVWGEEQWERFLGDMEFVTASKRPYFLGSIILKQASSGNTWSEVSEVRTVIDGQQRLTTMVIFFKALCARIDADRLFERDFVLETGEVALRHGKYDRQDFEKVVSATGCEPVEGSSSIVLAYNYFLKNIDPEKVDRNTIKSNVQFVCIDIRHHQLARGAPDDGGAPQELLLQPRERAGVQGVLGGRLRTHGGEEGVLGAGGRYRAHQAHARRPVLRRVPPDPGSGQEARRHDRGQALLFAHVQPLPVLQGLHRQVLQRRQGRDPRQHEGVCRGVRVHVRPRLLRRGHPLRSRRRAPERADIRPQELDAHPVRALRSQERGVFGRGIRGLRPA